MNKITGICIVFVMLTVLTAQAAMPTNQTDRISIMLENAPVSMIITMFQQLSGASFVYQSSDIPSRAYASVDVKNKPWRPVLSTVLEQHGLVISAVQSSPNTYNIYKLNSKESATRYHAANDTVHFIDTVIAELNNKNIDKAKALLAKHRKKNSEVIKALKPKRKTANQ